MSELPEHTYFKCAMTPDLVSLQETMEHAPEDIEVVDLDADLAMEHLSFRLPPDVKKRFKSMCRSTGKPVSNVLRAWVEASVREFNSIDPLL